MRLLATIVLGTACGASSPQSSAAGDPAAPARDGASPETAVLLCLKDGVDGPRTDYPFVASYRCADGATPLGGDPGRGAAARLGNVGQGPDGHVLDLYEIPCSAGPVRIYVDGYHCGPNTNVEIDMNDLSPEQLHLIARQMRALEGVVFEPEADEMRRSLAQWLQQSPQVHLSVCSAVIEDVIPEAYRHRELLFMQFVLSMGAAVIELSDAPEHQGEVELAAVYGALRLYESIVTVRGQDGADDHLTHLLRMSEDELGAYVEALAAPCTSGNGGGMGMTMSTDQGGNVWPPTGPDCDRLVRAVLREQRSRARRRSGSRDRRARVPPRRGAAGHRLHGRSRDAVDAGCLVPVGRVAPRSGQATDR